MLQMTISKDAEVRNNYNYIECMKALREYKLCPNCGNESLMLYKWYCYPNKNQVWGKYFCGKCREYFTAEVYDDGWYRASDGFGFRFGKDRKKL